MFWREEEKQSVKYDDLFQEGSTRREGRGGFLVKCGECFSFKAFWVFSFKWIYVKNFIMISLYWFERRIQKKSVSKEIFMKSLYVFKHDL